ncbi:MAG: excinuclease ABC subunit A [Flavobacteriales bacterium]|nr:MAG: excinuclease ABC subunit A [Flavobacteriales bacterium]
MKKVKNNNINKYIKIRGARQNNLKNINLNIKRNTLTVITGLSGSGKTTLAFDTLYAEGQRKYIESLSSYARQFMGKINKPLVDKIDGISPAIAVEQKINSTNPRSTVGTKTELFDYIRLLYARIGETFSPKSNEIVKKDSVNDVLDYLKSQPIRSKYIITCKPKILENNKSNYVKKLISQGFAMGYLNNEIIKLSEIDEENFENFELVIERIILTKNKNEISNLADSIEIAFFEGNGTCNLINLEDSEKVWFSNNFERDGIIFPEPNEHFFSFNNPYGACKKCQGYGNIIGIDLDLVVPNKNLSIFEGAIVPWNGNSFKKYFNDLINNSHKFSLPIHIPFYKLDAKQKELIWEGNEYFKGLNFFFKKIESKTYKIQNRVLLSRYRGKTECSECKGSRLRKETENVKINNKSIPQLLKLSINELARFFNDFNVENGKKEIAENILFEIKSRISFMQDVGLGYLTLNRRSNSLSGGESQRINLATSLGSSLVGAMYILDEPSIGLHSIDNKKLIKILKKLKNLGNTVIVVEHDEGIMKEADEIIDLGPFAGINGGEIVANGKYEDITKCNQSITGMYLNSEKKIVYPKNRKKINHKIILKGARENNLKNIDIEFPLNMMVAVTGVSGSGKSTLVKKILYPAILKNFDIYKEKSGEFKSLAGDLNLINQIEYIDQNPIGRSSRSNPVTYVKAYDDIRQLYSKQSLAKNRNYKPKHFSFNVDGGRCDKCKGEGVIIIEMQFMADVVLKCDECDGKRFKKEILQVKFDYKSIDEILKMTLDEAISFFEKNGESKLINKLMPLKKVGLGYITLGQSSSNISGGEAQRIKLASFIGKGDNKNKILFIFDEPTTGLHFHDINYLIKSLFLLIENGHSVIVVEHNLDMIKCADYIIDLGPNAGIDGGKLVASGTPEEIVKINDSHTGRFLKEKLI